MKNAFADCERLVAPRYQPQRVGSCRAIRRCTPQTNPFRSTTASALPASRTSRGSISLGRHHYACIELIARILHYERRFRKPDFRPVERSQGSFPAEGLGPRPAQFTPSLASLDFSDSATRFSGRKARAQGSASTTGNCSARSETWQTFTRRGKSVYAYFQNFNPCSDSGYKAASCQTLPLKGIYV